MFLQNQNKKINFNDNLSKQIFYFLFLKTAFKNNLPNTLIFIKYYKNIFYSLTFKPFLKSIFKKHGQTSPKLLVYVACLNSNNLFFT